MLVFHTIDPREGRLGAAIFQLGSGTSRRLCASTFGDDLAFSQSEASIVGALAVLSAVLDGSK